MERIGGRGEAIAYELRLDDVPMSLATGASSLTKDAAPTLTGSRTSLSLRLTGDPKAVPAGDYRDLLTIDVAPSVGLTRVFVDHSLIALSKADLRFGGKRTLAEASMVRMTRFTNSSGRVDDGGSTPQVVSCANAGGDRDPGRVVGLVGRYGRPLPERHNNAAIRGGHAGSAARP